MRKIDVENVREKILRAAMKVFAEHGYFRAPIHLVAQEARVSKGLIFWYFNSKDDLILEVAKRSLPGDVIEACLNMEIDGVELLRCIGNRYMEKYNNPVNRRLMLHTLSAEELYPPLRETIRKICTSYMEKIAKRVYGRNEKQDRVKIRTFFGSLLCYTLRKPEEIYPEEYLETLINILGIE